MGKLPTWIELAALIDAGVAFSAFLPGTETHERTPGGFAPIPLQLWQAVYACLHHNGVPLTEPYAAARARNYVLAALWRSTVAGSHRRRVEGQAMIDLFRAIAYGRWQDGLFEEEYNEQARNIRASLLTCRYADCIEQHRVASDDEQVTCATCRRALGLPAMLKGPLAALAIFVAFATATGCYEFSEPKLVGPVVYVQVDEGDWSANELSWIEDGAMEWRQLGFDVRPIGEAIDPTLTVLADTSRTNAPDLSTAIVLHLHRDATIYARGYAGLAAASTRDILLASELGETFADERLYDLRGVAAHEIGHQLLNAGHNPAGGVMGAPRTSWYLTQADLDFACAAAQRCTEGE